MLCWLMHWTLDDLRALHLDERQALIKLVREGKIKATVL